MYRSLFQANVHRHVLRSLAIHAGIMQLDCDTSEGWLNKLLLGTEWQVFRIAPEALDMTEMQRAYFTKYLGGWCVIPAVVQPILGPQRMLQLSFDVFGPYALVINPSGKEVYQRIEMWHVSMTLVDLFFAVSNLAEGVLGMVWLYPYNFTKWLYSEGFRLRGWNSDAIQVFYRPLVGYNQEVLVGTWQTQFECLAGLGLPHNSFIEGAMLCLDNDSLNM